MRVLKRGSWLGAPACLALAVAVHPGGRPRPLVRLPAAPSRTLTVFAAASLTRAFSDLGDSLERRTPGLEVRFNFAGSQQLALQIEQGAAADVFASADQRWMADVRDSGLVEGTPRVFAHNRLVVITPAAAPIAGLRDLARPGLKLVLAADAVPAGRYARAALLNLSRLPGFTAEFGRRALANVVSNEENVKAVVAKVQLGEADAGIVYVSDVTAEVAPRVRRIEVPDAANVVADYPVAVLRHAPDPEDARAFVALLLSPPGQAVLRANGLLAAVGD
ncbi:MAG TPA: molybdate ABC transporter substrate-binding protein [Gemmatimonadales bacterium]|nr:molybdate ABC transporter substrate-binding protein [Gemmatimonadales bacterium]